MYTLTMIFNCRHVSCWMSLNWRRPFRSSFEYTLVRGTATSLRNAGAIEYQSQNWTESGKMPSDGILLSMELCLLNRNTWAASCLLGFTYEYCTKSQLIVLYSLLEGQLVCLLGSETRIVWVPWSRPLRINNRFRFKIHFPSKYITLSPGKSW
jgi:hypothetical protein